MHRKVYQQLRFGRGLHGLGDTTKGGLHFADNAVIAPQFNAGRPGRYTIDVLVVGVPISADKRPYFNVGDWNDALAANGNSNVTVDSVEFVPTGAAANPRSSGGSFDIFDAGIPIADYTYRLTIDVGTPPADAGLAGMGAVTTVGWVIIAAVVISVDLLIYKLTGKDAIITAVRWLGEVLGEATKQVAKAAVPLVLLGVAAIALFVLVGGKGKFRGLSVGGD
jgi:hypothetical protein